MCGRFVQKAKKDEIEEEFDVKLPEETGLRPRYNLAPGQAALVIVNDSNRPRVESCMWGLIPSWVKDPMSGNRPINARVETLSEKPSFRDALRYRRCLIPANGFYEWIKDPASKQKIPLYFTWPQHPLFAFAGLWESWNDRDGGALYTFTIITRPANESCRSYHHRMPLILRHAEYADWLDKSRYTVDALEPVLSAGDVALNAHPVTNRVNQVENDDASCLEPVDWPEPPPPDPQLSLL